MDSRVQVSNLARQYAIFNRPNHFACIRLDKCCRSRYYVM